MKKKLPHQNVIKLCEEIAKDYERRRHNYNQRRLDIIYSCGSGAVEPGRSSGVSNPVEKKSERLEKLESGLSSRLIQAVEQSLMSAGSDVNRDSREKLRKAILLNCENGRDYPYEILGIDEFSRRDFYRRRKQFIIGIAENLGLADD